MTLNINELDLFNTVADEAEAARSKALALVGDIDILFASAKRAKAKVGTLLEDYNPARNVILGVRDGSLRHQLDGHGTDIWDDARLWRDSTQEDV